MSLYSGQEAKKALRRARPVPAPKPRRPRVVLPMNSPELDTARARVDRAFGAYDRARDENQVRVTPAQRAAIRELARAMNAHEDARVVA